MFIVIFFLLASTLPYSAPQSLSVHKWKNGPMFGEKGLFDPHETKPVERFRPCSEISFGKTMLDRSIDATGVASLHALGIKGNGVIIGIYDSGIDWQHYDFRNANGKTRILYLWDQTIDTVNGEHTPSYTNCKFGVEYTNIDINNELEGVTTGKIRSFDYGAHGTHVAGIAASNGLARNERTPAGGFVGVAPEASLIIVKGRYGDASVSAALDYMNKRAAELGMPLSVNFSFGGQTGAHDGTSITEKKIDSLFNSSARGRFIAVAAGNDNLDNIHLQKSFAVGETTWEIPFSIMDYTPHEGQYNDVIALSFWYPGSKNNHINISLYGPDASGNPTRQFGPFTYRATIPPQGELIDSLGYVEVYNATQETNGKDQILLYLIDTIENGRSIQPVAGNWKVVLTRTATAAAEMHGWYATFPERYDHTSIRALIPSANSSHSIVVPATSKEALTVGGFISARNWFSLTGDSVNYYKKEWPYYPEFDTLPAIGNVFPLSSHGPTVDNRIKPEITAPAEAVVAAMSKDINYYVQGLIAWDSIHIVCNGTSMAAPHVTGVAALLLSRNRQLDHAAIKNLLMQNAKRDIYTGSISNNVWGSGKLWADSLLSDLSVRNFNTNNDELFKLNIYPNPFNPLTTLKFKVLRGNEYKVSVYSANGRLIESFKKAVQPGSNQETIWDSSKLGKGVVSSGIVLFVIDMGGMEIKGKAILLR
jgi:subtilisin family serine protease